MLHFTCICIFVFEKIWTQIWFSENFSLNTSLLLSPHLTMVNQMYYLYIIHKYRWVEDILCLSEGEANDCNERRVVILRTSLSMIKYKILFLAFSYLITLWYYFSFEILNRMIYDFVSCTYKKLLIPCPLYFRN